MMTPDGSDKQRVSLPPPSLGSVRVKKQSFVDTPRRGISRFRRLLFCRSASAPRVELRSLVGLALLVLVSQSALSQTREELAPSAMGVTASLRLEPPTKNIRAFPQVSLGGGRELEYMGTFCANSKYKKSSKSTCASEALGPTSWSTAVPGEEAGRENPTPLVRDSFGRRGGGRGT